MKIKQPKNVADGNLKLKWNDDFAAYREADLNRAQRFVDSECIRLMKPYTPFRNGILEKSATDGTVIGSGEITQDTPYARYQYYGNLMVSSITGSAFSRGESKVLAGKPLNYDTSRHSMAGKLWFERMKTDRKKDILDGAAKIMKGIPK